MLIHGDSLEQLATLDNDSVDLLCTDPPYGYSFMGKSWDKALPDVGIFKECLRVLKPGAFAFVMSAPRSDVCSRMSLLLEEAGFNIAFTPIYWTYASGFPKAMNIGKMVDKRAGVEREVVGTTTHKGSNGGEAYGAYATGEQPVLGDAITDAAKALDGSYGGFQPKPAVEVVIVAMKPLSEKTYVDQALANGKGVTWLDDCRVPHNVEPKTANRTAPKSDGTKMGQFAENGTLATPNETGRFPANLLVSDDVLNDGRAMKSASFRKSGSRQGGRHMHEGGWEGEKNAPDSYGDSGSYSRFFDLDAWARANNINEHDHTNLDCDAGADNGPGLPPLQARQASEITTFPFLAVPKAAKSEKDKGLTGPEMRVMGGGGTYNEEAGRKFGAIKSAKKNTHPTVKPLKLMSYLITLGSRPGDVVLDPFLGSGTTAVAAKQLGRQWIGIEQESEYAEIAEARINAVHAPAPQLFAAE